MFLQTNKIKGILSFLIYCLACSSSMIYSDPSNHPSIHPKSDRSSSRVFQTSFYPTKLSSCSWQILKRSQAWQAIYNISSGSTSGSPPSWVSPEKRKPLKRRHPNQLAPFWHALWTSLRLSPATLCGGNFSALLSWSILRLHDPWLGLERRRPFGSALLLLRQSAMMSGLLLTLRQSTGPPSHPKM